MSTARNVDDLAARLRTMADDGADPVRMLWSAVTDRDMTFSTAAAVAVAAGIGDTEPEEVAYLVWLAAVDTETTARYRVGLFDLPDMDYAAWHNYGFLPSDVVARFIAPAVELRDAMSYRCSSCHAEPGNHCFPICDWVAHGYGCPNPAAVSR